MKRRHHPKSRTAKHPGLNRTTIKHARAGLHDLITTAKSVDRKLGTVAKHLPKRRSR
jgi:hypothetical protein